MEQRLLKLIDGYMRGDDVMQLQALLIAHGFIVDLDGIFGPKTQTAVKAFQKAEGLTVDGIVGPKTWTALRADTSVRAPEITAPTETTASREGLVIHTLSHIGDIYTWGANGETEITAEWIRRKETTEANAQRAIKFLEQQKAAGITKLAAFDCSGLISSYLQANGLASSKRNCNHLWAMCAPISRAELKRGDLLFRKNSTGMHHVGVYIGDGKVVEAKGRDDGVVLRGINASGAGYWNAYGALVALQ